MKIINNIYVQNEKSIFTEKIVSTKKFIFTRAFNAFLKRIGDITASLFFLMGALPVILIFCILIILESEGSPIYVQERMGKNKKSFRLYKLRSMYKNSEVNTGPIIAYENDKRVTRIGAFLRKTHMDELPQLINVILGDMSLVGPRPEREFFYKSYERECPIFSSRLCIKPGLTGLAQIYGSYDSTPHEKLEYDFFYINNQNIFFDAFILYKTFITILKSMGD